MKSVLENPQIALEKVENEIQLGRIVGPFQYSRISNLRCSPIGGIPKKTSGWRLITHLSYPTFGSVNDFMDEKFTSVQYSLFDNYSIQHYVINFVSDLRQVSGFLRVLRFPPPIKLTATI